MSERILETRAPNRPRRNFYLWGIGATIGVIGLASSILAKDPVYGNLNQASSDPDNTNPIADISFTTNKDQSESYETYRIKRLEGNIPIVWYRKVGEEIYLVGCPTLDSACTRDKIAQKPN